MLCGWIRDSPASRLLQTIPELIDPILADHPMHRAATSAELAGTCLFLASDLSSAVNGETIDAEDRFARILQHEVDHLNGVLFIDHLSSLKRVLYKKKLKKILRDEA